MTNECKLESKCSCGTTKDYCDVDDGVCSPVVDKYLNRICELCAVYTLIERNFDGFTKISDDMKLNAAIKMMEIYKDC